MVAGRPGDCSLPWLQGLQTPNVSGADFYLVSQVLGGGTYSLYSMIVIAYGELKVLVASDSLH